MFPSRHLFFGALFVFALFLIYPNISLIGLSLVLVSTVLIDVDHYLYYVYLKKDLNFFRARNWFFEQLKLVLKMSREERNKLDITKMVFVFHGLEVLGLLLITGLFLSEYFFFVFIGFGFHLILDVWFNLTLMDSLIKVSLIKDFIR